MSLCLYELSKNHEAQRKAQEEIDKVLATHQNINYDMMMDLKYLECCIDETLRKYPPAPFLIRECSKSYKIPNTELMIAKGTPVIIPLFGLHRDSDIFDDPLKFIPERFENSPTGEGKSKGLFYAPFGDGPRVCIGQRMGKLTSKIGLFLLLSKFNFRCTDELKKSEVEFSSKQFVLTLKNDINIKVSLRENKNFY